MQDTPQDDESQAIADDPVRRFLAADAGGKAAGEAAAKAAAAPYDQAALEALQDLIDGHGGNIAAAARELGMSKQALYKRMAKAGGTVPARPAAKSAVQFQPALWFESREDARDALMDWHLRSQSVNDERDAFLLGALAVGLDPIAISEYTEVPLETLRRIRPAGNVTVSALRRDNEEVYDAFARAVHAHATRLMDHAKAPTASEDPHTAGAYSVARIWYDTAESIIGNTAPYALMPDPTIRAEDYPSAEAFLEALATREPTQEELDIDKRPQSDVATINGPDALLATTYVRYRREAAKETTATDPNPEITQAIRQAFSDIADAIAYLRTTGEVPPALLEAS
ncbi:helix-turn-helix domain-containing protein [Streptomyces sp. NPDC007872]|uniref:helix-turn-helix domain-containing protein n=1 Tax=Streptomyces sp. NPDC007872 TaxID=3364782 RepID=UPI0036AD05CF